MIQHSDNPTLHNGIQALISEAWWGFTNPLYIQYLVFMDKLKVTKSTGYLINHSDLG